MDGSRPAQQPRRAAEPVRHAGVSAVPGGRGGPSRGHGQTSCSQAGEDANTISDVYTLTTLLFAAVLFFAAMAERFEYLGAQVSLLVIAGIGLVVGLSIALGQPITSG